MSTTWKYWDDEGDHEWVAGTSLPAGTILNKTEFVNQFAKRFVQFTASINGSTAAKWVSNNYWDFVSSETYTDMTVNQISAGAVLQSFIPTIQQYLCLIGMREDAMWANPLSNEGDYSGLPNALTAGYGIPAITPTIFLNALGYSGTTPDPYVSSTYPFRRSTDGETFEFGGLKKGDIIGRWIFEDLRTAFELFTWRLFTDGGLNKVIGGETLTREGYGRRKSTEYEAKSDAISRFSSAEDVSISDSFSVQRLDDIRDFKVYWQAYVYNEYATPLPKAWVLNRYTLPGLTKNFDYYVAGTLERWEPMDTIYYDYGVLPQNVFTRLFEGTWYGVAPSIPFVFPPTPPSGVSLAYRFKSAYHVLIMKIAFDPA